MYTLYLSGFLRHYLFSIPISGHFFKIDINVEKKLILLGSKLTFGSVM